MFGMMVREKRESLSWTQEQLAEKCEVTGRTISRIEAGLPPSKRTRQRLVEVLSFNSDELLEERTEPVEAAEYEFTQRLACTSNVCCQILTTKPMNKFQAQGLSNRLSYNLGKLLDRLPGKDGGHDPLLKLWRRNEIGIRPSQLRAVAHDVAAACGELLCSRRPFEWDETTWAEEPVTFPPSELPPRALKALIKAAKLEKSGAYRSLSFNFEEEKQRPGQQG